MKRDSFSRPCWRSWCLTVFSLGLICLGTLGSLWADQIQMQNGDLYFGKVASMSDDTVVVQSDLLGTVRLPRGKVSHISLGTGSPSTASITNSQPRPQAAVTNATSDYSALLRQIGSNTNLIRQVQSTFLAGAGPEANARFTELLGGLSSGKLSVNDLAAQARSAADQMRAARKDLGDEAGWMIDSYLAILDHFVKEAGLPAGGATNNTKVTPRSKALLEDN